MQARSEVTIKSIKDALRRLMASRPLSEITIREISYVRELYIGHIRMGQDFSQLYNSPNFILLREIIEGGQSAGQIRKDLSAEEIAEQIVMVCEGWQYTWCVNAGSYSLTEYFARHIDPVLSMIKQP